MGLNVALFNALAPEFASLSPGDSAKRDLLATLAAGQADAITFGANYDAAIALLTAHFMKRFPTVGATAPGFMTSEKVGDLSQARELVMKTGSGYETTAYGEMFLQLRKQLVKSPFFPVYASEPAIEI